MTHKLFIYPDAKAQFQSDAIGTFVSNPYEMEDLILETLETFDFPNNGIAFLNLPEEALDYVTAGVEKRSLLSKETEVVRDHRGLEQTFLDRKKVEIKKPDKVGVVLYTKEAYILDRVNEMQANQKNDQRSQDFIEEVTKKYTAQLEKEFGDSLYVWVTTIASKGTGKPPVGPFRFVHNLASRNPKYTDIPERVTERAAEYIRLIELDPKGQRELDIEDTLAWRFCQSEAKSPNPRSSVTEARDIIEYWSEWVVVSTEENPHGF